MDFRKLHSHQPGESSGTKPLYLSQIQDMTRSGKSDGGQLPSFGDQLGKPTKPFNQRVKEFDPLMTNPLIDGFNGKNQEQIETEYEGLKTECQRLFKEIGQGTSEKCINKIVEYNKKYCQFQQYGDDLKGYVSKKEGEQIINLGTGNHVSSQNLGVDETDHLVPSLSDNSGSKAMLPPNIGKVQDHDVEHRNAKTSPSQTGSERVIETSLCLERQVSSRKQLDEIPHRERVLPNPGQYNTFERWFETSQTLPRRAEFINKLDELCKEQSSVKQLWKFCQELQQRLGDLKARLKELQNDPQLSNFRTEVSYIQHRHRIHLAPRMKEIQSKLGLSQESEAENPGQKRRDKDSSANLSRNIEKMPTFSVNRTPSRINGKSELLTEYIKIIGEQWFDYSAIVNEKKR